MQKALLEASIIEHLESHSKPIHPDHPSYLLQSQTRVVQTAAVLLSPGQSIQAAAICSSSLKHARPSLVELPCLCHFETLTRIQVAIEGCCHGELDSVGHLLIPLTLCATPHAGPADIQDTRKLR